MVCQKLKSDPATKDIQILMVTALNELGDIERASVDYYATLRTYYLQRRARLIEDKAVQTAELPDF